MKGISGLALGMIPAVFSISPAAAQDGATRPLEEVVVRSTKLEKSFAELTQSVTVIDEIEIEQKAFSDFTEVLRKTAGLEFKQAGGPGQFNYPKMRGFATGAILVVVDGVKINEASSGGVSNLLGQIDPASIERVEVLRGPQAVLYGANSTAGVISITTKSGRSRSARLQLESGSLDWRRGAVSVRNTVDAGRGAVAYSLNASKIDSGNVHAEEFTRDETLQGKISYDLARVGMGLTFWQTNNEFQSAELDEAGCCETRETHWAFQTPDPNQVTATKSTVIGAYLQHEISERWSQRFQAGAMQKDFAILDAADGLLGYHPAPFDGFQFPAFTGPIYSHGELVPVEDTIDDVASFYDDENRQLDYNLIYQGDRAGMLIGAEYLEQRARQWGSYGAADNEESVRSLYVNGELDAGERVVVALGLRVDEFDSWGRETTGNVGLAVQLGAASSLFVNVGTSFTAPTMSQLFNPVYGDAHLKPQGGETVELGWRYNGADERLALESTLWHTVLDDVIVYDGAIVNRRSTSGFGQYTNRDRQRTEGVELTARFALTDRIALDGNYTYTRSDNKAADGDWERTVQIAKNKANIGLDYQGDRFYVSGNLYYSGPRLRWAADIEMKEYTRFDLAGRFSFTDALSAYVRIENVFDTDIEEALGYEQPGRYSVVGIQYSFF
jgi:vitamin B12 transporter